jgi:very-short-patch-repair endonuclease
MSKCATHPLKPSPGGEGRVRWQEHAKIQESIRPYMKHTVYKNKYLTKYARSLRQKQTRAEIVLWCKIRNKQLLDIKFRRQVPIIGYIVDFYSEELNLIIEIDGASHDDKKSSYDNRRHKVLKDLGFEVIRVTEKDVMNSVEYVIETICNYIQKL